jgi:hypothetical protein
MYLFILIIFSKILRKSLINFYGVILLPIFTK